MFLEAIRNKAEEFFRFLEQDIQAAGSFEDKLSCFLRLPMKYIFKLMPILAEAFNQVPPYFLQRLEENKQDYHRRMSALFGEIMRFGMDQGILDKQVDIQRLGEIINDWFLLGDCFFDRGDKDRIIGRIERDHDLIIKILLWGVIKRKA